MNSSQRTITDLVQGAKSHLARGSMFTFVNIQILTNPNYFIAKTLGNLRILVAQKAAELLSIVIIRNLSKPEIDLRASQFQSAKSHSTHNLNCGSFVVNAYIEDFIPITTRGAIEFSDTLGGGFWDSIKKDYEFLESIKKGSTANATPLDNTYSLGFLRCRRLIILVLSLTLIIRVVSIPIYFFLEWVDFSLLGSIKSLVQSEGPNHPSYNPNTYRNKRHYHIALKAANSMHLYHISPRYHICHSRYTFGLFYLISLETSLSQPLGSIPNRRSFSQQDSFTHALKLPLPATASICVNKASSKRMFFTVLLERSNSRFVFFSCIGIYRWCNVFIDGIYHFVFNQELKTAKLGSVSPLTEPLTTNDNLSIEVAMYKYTFLIGKGKARLSDINPIRLITVLAQSENEARSLAGNPHLVFAGRLPVQGVIYA